MEEKKLNSVDSQKDNNEQKLTYEQLNEACGQLYQQNQNLMKQLQQANLTNMFRRLDYLFMVLKYSSTFNDEKFVNACVEEIKEAISIDSGKEDSEKEG